MVILNDEPSKFYYIKVGKGCLNNMVMLNDEPSQFYFINLSSKES